MRKEFDTFEAGEKIEYIPQMEMVTPDELFVLQELRKRTNDDYVDFTVEKRKFRYYRVSATIAALRP